MAIGPCGANNVYAAASSEIKATRQNSLGMTSPSPPPAFFIGWDVGGWNCDTNSKSRDAIVILDAHRAIVGKPWRCNLRTTINNAQGSRAFIEALFQLCETKCPSTAIHVTLAIDTPLGFPEAFTALATGLRCVESVEDSGSNPYLFRQTERWLCEQGLRPLSAIKDMIGSQATKGMHVLAKFAPHLTCCGVWTDGDMLTAIEAYPSPCEYSALMTDLSLPYVAWQRVDGVRGWIGEINHKDKQDALTCALIAYCFDARPEMLAQPPHSVPPSEGWIWLPRDALLHAAGRKAQKALQMTAPTLGEAE